MYIEILLYRFYKISIENNNKNKNCKKREIADKYYLFSSSVSLQKYPDLTYSIKAIF